MNSTPKKKTSKNPSDVELLPDAWSRFERAMAVVVKSPPQHRAKPKARKKAAKRQPAKKSS